MSVEKRIWFRSVCMLITAMRYEMEIRYSNKILYEDDYQFFVKLIEAVTTNKILSKEMTVRELILLKMLPGQWPTNEYVQYSWYIESMGCLLWGLNEFEEFPPHDEGVSSKKVDEYFGHVGDAGARWLDNLLKKEFMRRSENELNYELKRAEILYKRCLISFKVRNNELKITTKKYSDLFPMKEYNLPIGPSGDLIVNGREFCDISPFQEGNLCPMALMRLQSITWMLNPELCWDDVHIHELEVLPI
jgi:hypothetical protein